MEFWRDEALQFTVNHTYDVQFGPVSAITVDVFAPDRRFYTTSYVPPNPPPAAGAVRLGPRGAIMSIGLYAVLGPDLQSGVALAGGTAVQLPAPTARVVKRALGASAAQPRSSISSNRRSRCFKATLGRGRVLVWL